MARSDNMFSAFVVKIQILFFGIKFVNSLCTSLNYSTLFSVARLEQGSGPLPGSWTYHNNQVDQNRKDQLSVSGGNKVTVVMSKSSDRLSPMMKETRSKFKKSQSIDEIDIGSYKVYRYILFQLLTLK